jgi:pilus assembly protein CpaE
MQLTSMKIALIAPRGAALDALRRVLQSADGALQLSAHAGGAALAARIAEQEQPDILLIGGEVDGAALRALEPLAMRHPGMAVMLLSANHSTEFLRESMRIGVREVLAEPASREALQEAIARVRQRAVAAPSRRARGRIVSFLGCKGGSGATFLATNMAYVLAEQEQKKVCVIDLNLHFGDAALYVTHRRSTATLADVTGAMHRLDGALLAASMVQVMPNLHLLPAPDAPEQALQVRPESIAPLLQLAAAEYDLVLIDAGRALESVTLCALDRSDLIYAVLQLDLPFLHDAKRMLHALSELGYGGDKLRLLVNRYEKGGTVTLDDALAALNCDNVDTVPNSFRAVAASVNEGVPICKLSARDPVARSLAGIARRLIGDEVKAPAPAVGWLRSVLSAH